MRYRKMFWEFWGGAPSNINRVEEKMDKKLSLKLMLIVFILVTLSIIEEVIYHAKSRKFA